MDQEAGAGHQLITQVAVSRLFESARNDERLLGLNQAEFFRMLDKGQHHADRVGLDGGQTLGDTWHPSWLDHSAQRRHSMADPTKSGDQNLSDIRAFIVSKLSLAQAGHRERDHKLE